MKKALLIISILILAGCARTGIPECDWQPKRGGYGPCEMMCDAGVYYDNSEQKCKVLIVGGCECPEIPFDIDFIKYRESFDECASIAKYGEEQIECIDKLIYSEEFTSECKQVCER